MSKQTLKIVPVIGSPVVMFFPNKLIAKFGILPTGESNDMFIDVGVGMFENIEVIENFPVTASLTTPVPSVENLLNSLITMLALLSVKFRSI